MTTSAADAPRRSSGRLFLVLGLVLAALGALGYAALIAARRPTTWSLPASATLAAALLVVALWRKRSVWRVLALVVVALLAAAEWGFFLKVRLPSYTGPVAAGEPFPAFTTTRADGTPFTQRELEGERNHVLVFFRGRW